MAFKYFDFERTKKVNMTFSYTGAKFQMRSRSDKVLCVLFGFVGVGTLPYFVLWGLSFTILIILLLKSEPASYEVYLHS